MELFIVTSPQTYDILLGYVGVIVLVSIIFPRILPKHLITAPIAYLILAEGWLLAGIIFLCPKPDCHNSIITAGALVILLIIRPVSGVMGLAGAGLSARKMLFVSFYGIRGIGSLYYLLYAFHHGYFEGTGETLALVMTVVVMSLVLHGLSARAVIKKILPD